MFNPEIHRERYRIVNERFPNYGRIIVVIRESIDKVYFHYEGETNTLNISHAIFDNYVRNEDLKKMITKKDEIWKPHRNSRLEEVE
jgi:hypothetical protein